MSHTVYRVFDKDDLLLYVGCTNNLSRRMSHHRKWADWFPYMTRHTTEALADAASALEREADVITAERPWFNGCTEDLVSVGHWRGTYLRHIHAGADEQTARNAASDKHGACRNSEWRHARYLAQFA